MKKVLFGIILCGFIFVSKGYTAGLYHLNGDTVYRTTAPTTAIAKMFIASGSIYVPNILVSSASLNIDSSCLLSDATGVFVAGMTLSSTYTYATNTTGGQLAYVIPINRVFPQGLMLTTIGTSKIEVRWGWITGKAQPGHESDGW